MGRGVEEYFNKDKLYLLGGIVCCFLISFNQALGAVSIFVWVFLSLIRKNQTHIKSFLWIPVGLFLVYSCSLLLSYNGSLGILQRKLSLLTFPVIFYLNYYGRLERRLLFRSFIFGLALSGVVCLLIAVFRSLIWEEGGLTFKPAVLSGKDFFDSVIYGGNYFFGRYFSFFHQTVYYAFYLCTGISLLLFTKNLFNSQRKRWGLIGFFVFLLFLISNRGSFLALGGILALFIISNARTIYAKIGLISLLLIMSFAMLKSNPRFNEGYNRIMSGEFKLDKNARYGYSTRLLSWDAAWNLVRQSPLTGYGVARAQDQLDAEYKRLGYSYPLKNYLNAHNQFLQFWIESGMLGLLSWILVFVALLFLNKQATETDRLFVYSFIIILFVNSLFESVMNRYSGISFIAFFLSLILSTINVKQSD